ncbi:MAG: glycosyltransferase family 2 protein, partial [Candidatus Omnitrophota bacterium]
MIFSILIPAKNEEKNIAQTVKAIADRFKAENFAFEILVIDDGSADNTSEKAKMTGESESIPLRVISNPGPFGIGNAIKIGLQEYRGDAVIITMADLSDSPQDMVQYAKIMEEEGVDCCFGDRWSIKGLVTAYPQHKLLLNRLANWFIALLFGITYRDVTNAFKCYSRQTIEGLKPLLSHHFNITVELPLKAITRGFSYKIVPTKWRNRQKGVSQLKIREMGSRYLFIILYI